MNQDEKNEFDALMDMKRFEFEQISERRDGEWKLTLTIWSGLGVIIVALLKIEGLRIPKDTPAIVLLALAAIVLLLHIGFLHGVARGHLHNRNVADRLSRRMAVLSGVEPHEGVKKGSDKADGKVDIFDWSRGTQFFVSCLLVVCIAALWYLIPADTATPVTLESPVPHRKAAP